MNVKTFNKHLTNMQKSTVTTLVEKAKEYSANDDRLHNFHTAASLTHSTPEHALGGMMLKHTVSVYDMLNGVEAGNTYPVSLWEEKIKDHINYLFLLWALVNERNNDEHISDTGRTTEPTDVQ